MSDSLSAEIASLLAATDRATSNKARGDVLEKLAGLVLGAVPGVEVIGTNSLDVHRSEEVDLVLLNRQRSDGLDLFPAFILAECKNWKNPVDSQGVAAFARKVETRGQSVGFLMTRRGITGDPRTLSASQQVISEELAKGREIVVITEADLAKIRTPADIARLLLVRRSSLMISRGFVETDGWLVGSGEPCGSDDSAAPSSRGRSGWDGVAAAIRQEEERVCAQMLGLVPDLPADAGAAAQVLIDSTNSLHERIDAAVAADEDPHAWQPVLDAMLDVGALAIAFFHRDDGWEREPNELVSSIGPFKPNVRYVAWDSRLFKDLLTYYSLEVSNQEDLDGRTATLSLLGMMVESHWRLDDSLAEWMQSQAD